MRGAVRAARARRGGVLTLFVAAIVAVLGWGASPASSVAPSHAPDELRSLIEDVTGATAYRYRVTDDRGHTMDTAKIVWVPEAQLFAAVYHTYSQAERAFQVHLASSSDVLHWAWQATLADRAAQASIELAVGGGYVVAWEQSPDPIHLELAYYATWSDLVGGAALRRHEVPASTPGCAEGTPSIEYASYTRVDLAFHYFAGCRHDRQARGSSDWATWTSATRSTVDLAVTRGGAGGHIGDRDGISFRGHDLVLIEGQLTLDAPGTWRTFLYDPTSGSAARIRFRSHAGSTSFANPTIEKVRIDGRDALLVTLFIFSEGAAWSEAGQLIYYRTLPS